MNGAQYTLNKYIKKDCEVVFIENNGGSIGNSGVELYLKFHERMK
jgi:hypothetical protein